MGLDIPAKHLKISRRRYLVQNGPLPDKIVRLKLTAQFTIAMGWNASYRLSRFRDRHAGSASYLSKLHLPDASDFDRRRHLALTRQRQNQAEMK